MATLSARNPARVFSAGGLSRFAFAGFFGCGLCGFGRETLGPWRDLKQFFMFLGRGSGTLAGTLDFLASESLETFIKRP